MASGVFLPDVIAQGSLTTEASLYSPGAGEHLAYGTLIYYNTGSSTRTITTKITKSGGSATVVDLSVLAPSQKAVLEGIQIGPSDDLRALQDSGTDVKYTLYGGSDV